MAEIFKWCVTFKCAVDLGSDGINPTMNGSQALVPCGRSSPSISLASPSLSINTSFPGRSTSVFKNLHEIIG